MTFLMSQMLVRRKNISNEISCAQFRVVEDLQKFPATAHFIFSASFYSFAPVLEELICEGI